MPKTTYVLQRNGQVTLPSELREEFQLKTGDEVEFIRVNDGWKITKTEPDPIELLDQLGSVLKSQGITLEELIKDGDAIRESLVEEIYGLTSKSDD